MTTKGKKATVAIVSRSLRRIEAAFEDLRRSFGRLEPRVDQSDEMLETVSVDLDRVEADAYDLNRQVADLEDRIAVLEAPFWRRRKVKFEALARRLARQREHAAIVEAGIKAGAAELDEKIKGELMPDQETVDRVVENALAADDDESPN